VGYCSIKLEVQKEDRVHQRIWISVTLVGCALGTLGAASSISGHGAVAASGEVPSLGELLESVQARIDGVSRLEAEYRFDSDLPTPDHVGRSLSRVIVEGNKLFRDEHYGLGSQAPEPLGHATTIHDGKATTRINHGDKSAIISLGAPWYARSQGDGFFDLNAMNPDNPMVDGPGDQSLLSTLKSSWTSVRPLTEKVGEVECVVIDYRSPASGAVVFTAWLDTARGCLPLRQIYNENGPASVRVEFNVDKSFEAMTGCWIATKGTKKVQLGGKPAAFSLEVKGWNSSQPKVTVNGAVPEDPFKAEIPSDYVIVDTRS
jgi:hypothetical protein